MLNECANHPSFGPDLSPCDCQVFAPPKASVVYGIIKATAQVVFLRRGVM